MFDIKEQTEVAKLEDGGTDVHVRDLEDKLMYFEENGERKPVVIRITGVNSSQYRRAEEVIRRRKFKPGKLTTEIFHHDTIEKTAACTLSWQGFASDGVLVPCTLANAVTLYITFPWLLDQITEAQNDHTRFSGSSSEQL